MDQLAVLEDAAAVEVLSNSVRMRILAALSEPSSAASVARAIGQSRQNTNYHLKELERAGLVERAGERRAGSFIESLYAARARTFVISPRLTLGGPERAEALAGQLALSQLLSVGERIGQDAAVLLDRAAFDGEAIPSASVEVDVRFASEDDREAFLNEYLRVVASLAKKYRARRGDPYRVAMVAYPDTRSESGAERPKGAR